MEGLFELLRSWGPLGVLLIATLDAAGVPLPAGVDVSLIGLAIVSPTRAYLAVPLGVLGSLIGNLFLYTVARKGGEAYLDRKIQTGRARRFRDWFQHYGLITVFIPTFVPIVPLPLKVFVLSAGAFGVSRRAFLLTILVARVPRFLAMAYLGSQLGANSLGWLRDHAWHLAGVAAGLFVFLFLLVKWVDRRRGRGATVPVS